VILFLPPSWHDSRNSQNETLSPFPALFLCTNNSRGKTCTNHPWVEGVRGHSRDAVTKSSLCPRLFRNGYIQAAISCALECGGPAAAFAIHGESDRNFQWSGRDINRMVKPQKSLTCGLRRPAKRLLKATFFPACRPLYWACYTFSPSSAGLPPSEAGMCWQSIRAQGRAVRVLWCFSQL
jgi:hypothetical protein